ncbi:hypothetical protein BDY24DRAFT_107437 [Mrakia frigida]|uniref:uncharacterized protein n=1 Tax=Mrakia frigida TaxID=29902 RepID=UPI003FCBFEB8
MIRREGREGVNELDSFSRSLVLAAAPPFPRAPYLVRPHTELIESFPRLHSQPTNLIADSPSSSPSLEPSSSPPNLLSNDQEPEHERDLTSKWSFLYSQISAEEDAANSERAERRRREEEMQRNRAELKRVEDQRVEKAREAIRLRRSANLLDGPPPSLLTATTARSSAKKPISTPIPSTSEPTPSTSSGEGAGKESKENFQRITSDEWALIKIVRASKVKPSLVGMQMFMNRLNNPKLSQSNTKTNAARSANTAPFSSLPSQRQRQPPPFVLSQTRPIASPTKSSTIPYTFSSDPYLSTPTSAHFADPASRTIFLHNIDRSFWWEVWTAIKKGTLSSRWLPEDEDSVKMRKGWEGSMEARKLKEERRAAAGTSSNPTPTPTSSTPITPEATPPTISP